MFSFKTLALALMAIKGVLSMPLDIFEERDDGNSTLEKRENPGTGYNNGYYYSF
jgi:hypothetical protein